MGSGKSVYPSQKIRENVEGLENSTHDGDLNGACKAALKQIDMPVHAADGTINFHAGVNIPYGTIPLPCVLDARTPVIS